MTLPSPDLDDRDFHALLQQAVLQMKQSCPDWNDHSPHDPGMVLLELFAHLTETMIYRLNRLPEKVYVELLNLLGVQLQAPAAAVVTLQFSTSRPAAAAIAIPRGTRVTVQRADGEGRMPVFTTDEAAAIAAGQTAVEVSAHCCELAEAELVGTATGLPGFSVEARHLPLCAPVGDGRDLVVGVEADGEHLEGRATAVRHEDATYRVWQEVDGFDAADPAARLYVVDRVHGRITFAPAARLADEAGLHDAPAALAAVPEAGRRIRLWYRYGGGAHGNVAAGTLQVLKDPLPGVRVSNPAPATGGRDVETLANALVRGPLEFRSLHRAVTAEDYELLACRASGAVTRARAFTLARAPDAEGMTSGLWVHATPGAVEVVLVPAVPEQEIAGGRVPARLLCERENDDELARVRGTLDARRPLGTSVRVSWARYKTVRVRARVVTHREENPEQVRQRVLERLHRTINPLATDARHAGWTFGRPLRASTVYDIALSEPGVSYVDGVELLVDDTPGQAATAVAIDVHQPRCWFAGAGQRAFRTLNDGAGWEPVAELDGEQVLRIETHPSVPGLLAVVGHTADGSRSRVHLSSDCGESWLEQAPETDFSINDVAWTQRGEWPLLLLATDRGLFELPVRPGASMLQLLLDEKDQDLGGDAVVVARLPGGDEVVAVAAQQTRGVLLSNQQGRSGSFRSAGPAGVGGISTMAVQRDGPRSFLWIGLAAEGGDAGKGCMRLELRRSADAPAEWESRLVGWLGGSCRALAFGGEQVFATTHRAGVLRAQASRPDSAWQATAVDCGLPLRDPGRLHPVDTIASGALGRLLLAGGPAGLFRSRDGGVTWTPSARVTQGDRVTIPANWLLCSGEHELSVASEDQVDDGA